MKQRIRTAEGLELAAAAWRGDGQPLLFVHGFSHDGGVWDEVARGLPRDFRPLGFDLRGHGDSDWSLDCRYDLADHAGDIGAVLDGLGVGSAILVGHSLGGNAATLFAARHPERVRALVLVDTGPSLSAEAWQWAAGDVSEMARAYESVEQYRQLLALAYPTGAPAALARLAQSSLTRRADGRFEPKLDPVLLELLGTPEQWHRTQRALWDALAALCCPALVLRGERSAMLAEAVARRMAEDVLPDGRWASVDAAGHAVPIDNAPGLLAQLSRFVQGLDQRAPAPG